MLERIYGGGVGAGRLSMNYLRNNIHFNFFFFFFEIYLPGDQIILILGVNKSLTEEICIGTGTIHSQNIPNKP